MKEWLKDIVKGMVIGVANIIPGVSGGTMAVSMGIYDKLIRSVTHLFSEFKKSIKVIIPVVIGAGVGIVILSAIIQYLLGHFPVQTNFLFIGLIVGGLPVILTRLKGTGKKVSLGNLITLCVFFALVVLMAALGEGVEHSADVSGSFLDMFKLFGVGIVASATMVIPGVSGSMVLMLMGYYSNIIDAITRLAYYTMNFDIQGIMMECSILVPMGIGIVIGIFAIAKLVEIVFQKLPNYAYSAIIGLIIASPVAIKIGRAHV